jgi:hypothetical protein
MSTFVIALRTSDAHPCHCCGEPSVWELYPSNNPNRKLGCCDEHREETRLAIVTAQEQVRKRWEKVLA